jgi:hypothetical protein
MTEPDGFSLAAHGETNYCVGEIPAFCPRSGQSNGQPLRERQV